MYVGLKQCLRFTMSKITNNSASGRSEGNVRRSVQKAERCRWLGLAWVRWQAPLEEAGSPEYCEHTTAVQDQHSNMRLIVIVSL